MKKIKLILLGSAVSFLLITACQKADQSPKDLTPSETNEMLSPCSCAGLFEGADVNFDGKLTQTEWTAASFPATDFSVVDTNGDGRVTLLEWSAYCNAEMVCERNPECPNCP